MGFQFSVGSVQLNINPAHAFRTQNIAISKKRPTQKCGTLKGELTNTCSGA
jgi:hypothetical protein